MPTPAEPRTGERASVAQAGVTSGLPEPMGRHLHERRGATAALRRGRPHA
jgi:hypothetical protein